MPGLPPADPAGPPSLLVAVLPVGPLHSRRMRRADQGPGMTAGPAPVSVPFSAPANVKLDGSGNGTAKLGPIALREVWTVATASVRVSSANSEAACSIYAGPDTSSPNFADATFTGSSGDSTTNFGQPITAGMYVWAVWTGGDPGATATLVVAGSKDIY